MHTEVHKPYKHSQRQIFLGAHMLVTNSFQEWSSFTWLKIGKPSLSYYYSHTSKYCEPGDKETVVIFQDFRLLLSCNWDLPSFGVLHSAGGKCVTNLMD